MNIRDEKFAVTAGLVCLCPLVAASVAVPGVGYVLLGAVVLGVAALIGRGVFLWWDTRFQPENLPRRASQEAAARARQISSVRQEVA
jgi:hypothetical protein